jgi:hypothetical protein
VLLDCCAIAGMASPTARIEVIKNGCNLIPFLPSIHADIRRRLTRISYPGPGCVGTELHWIKKRRWTRFDFRPFLAQGCCHPRAVCADSGCGAACSCTDGGRAAARSSSMRSRTAWNLASSNAAWHIGGLFCLGGSTLPRGSANTIPEGDIPLSLVQSDRLLPPPQEQGSCSVCIERSELRGAIASEGLKQAILQIDQYGFEFSRAPH